MNMEMGFACAGYNGATFIFQIYGHDFLPDIQRKSRHIRESHCFLVFNKKLPFFKTHLMIISCL